MNDPVAIGDVVADKYTISGVLGRGGIGIVYAAEHVTLRRRVALKFLRPELLARGDVVQRFLREGRAAAQLQSEHVARVLDADATPAGAPYLVMELLEGRDLATLVKDEGALPIATAADYILQACEAVAEAHAVGILHRDLKSDNLFLTRSPLGAPLVKVLDFGLSKIAAAETEAGITSDNHIMGSPHFMSPEQMRSSRDVDARSDLWGLGVVLYTLLTGRVPFQGKYFTEVCAAVLSGNVTPLEALRPEVPPRLVAVVARCLRLEREERYPSASALATALGPFAGSGGGARAARIAQLVAERKGSDSSAAKPVVAELPAAEVPNEPTLPSAVVEAPRAKRRWGASAIVGGSLFVAAAAGAIAFLPRVPGAAAPQVSTAADFSAPSAATEMNPVPSAPASPSASASAPVVPSPSPVAAPPPALSSRARLTNAPAAPSHARPRPRRPESEEDVILKLPH